MARSHHADGLHQARQVGGQIDTWPQTGGGSVHLFMDELERLIGDMNKWRGKVQNLNCDVRGAEWKQSRIESEDERTQAILICIEVAVAVKLPQSKFTYHNSLNPPATSKWPSEAQTRQSHTHVIYPRQCNRSYQPPTPNTTHGQTQKLVKNTRASQTEQRHVQWNIIPNPTYHLFSTTKFVILVQHMYMLPQ